MEEKGLLDFYMFGTKVPGGALQLLSDYGGKFEANKFCGIFCFG